MCCLVNKRHTPLPRVEPMASRARDGIPPIYLTRDGDARRPADPHALPKHCTHTEGHRG